MAAQRTSDRVRRGGTDRGPVLWRERGLTSRLPTILLGCEEVPGWGGASTVGYRLYELLRGAGLDAVWVNLLAPEDVDYFRFVFGGDFGNPRRLDEVHNFVVDGPPTTIPDGLRDFLDRRSPAVLVGIGHTALRRLARAGGGRPAVFLATGCQQAKDMIERGESPDLEGILARFGDGARHPPMMPGDELEAVREADLVVTHADVLRSLYRAFYPSYAGKIWPTPVGFAGWIHGEAAEHASLARPFDARDIDALFVSSTWSRPEKNYRLVRQIAAAMPGARIHIVGDFDIPCPGATHHGVVADRSAVFALMGRARTVVCPSRLDVAPGILFEASALGSNVIASRNCGNWRLCHDELVVERMAPETFAQAIRAALDRKYEDRMASFLTGDPLAALTGILAVM